jgi:hypothetical protein
MASAEGQEPVERDLLCWDMVVCLPVSASARPHAIHSMRFLAGKLPPVSCGEKQFWLSFAASF